VNLGSIWALSYRDVEQLLAERGIDVDHVTIYRWVERSPHCPSTRPSRHTPRDRWFIDATLRQRFVGLSCTEGDLLDHNCGQQGSMMSRALARGMVKFIRVRLGFHGCCTGPLVPKV
jgi:hypothetical protein